MGAFRGPNTFGFFRNGDFREGSNSNFTFGTYVGSGGPNNEPYIEITGGGGGSGLSSDFMEVDVNNTYQMIMYAKTIQTGSNPEGDGLAGGHLGFACYDSDKNFIDRRNLKGLGDTTLTRDHSPGDNALYVADASGWATSEFVGHRGYNLFGGQYPYSEGYTRYKSSDDAYATNGITNIGGGEWRIDLNSGKELGTYSDVLSGGVYPAGTYVSNAKAGSTYNYVLSAPNYPTTWTRYSTTPEITGEAGSEQSSISTIFRYKTKYIKFMILKNYNRRNVTQDHVYGLSQIFFGRILDNKDYRNIL